MLQTFLVPEKTVVSAKGDGPATDISRAEVRVFLLTLKITEIIEQESLDVSIFGSMDGANWETKPVAAFPQKFYRDEAPLLLNLSDRPNLNFIRAHREVQRWGRGTVVPMFEFSVQMQEVPQEILAEAEANAEAGRGR
jgi:hypothetical protein